MNEYFADVFGVQFPVCSLEQKLKLEAAFKSASEHEKAEGEFKHDCTCDLITALLAPETPRGAAIIAAWAIARDVYNRKQAGLMLLNLFTPPPPQPTGRAN